MNKDGSFDEHKVMYGFDTEQEARDAYLSNYEEGWTGLGTITGVNREEFRKWVDSSHRKTKPFAEYSGVRVSNAQYEDNTDKKTTSSEGDDAVSGNPSTGGLPQGGSAHLSRQSLTSQSPLDAAKVLQNTLITARAARKIQNEGGLKGDLSTESNAVRILGKELHLRRSKSSQSYYNEFYEGQFNVNGRTVEVRVSTHPANGATMGNAPTDDKISIVIRKNGEHVSTGPHNGYIEYVFEPTEVSPKDAANAIVQGVESIIRTGDFTDVTGKAHKYEYPYIDKSGNKQYSLSEVDPEKMTDEEKSGIRYSLVEDPEEIRRLDNEKLAEGFRNVSLKDDGTMRSPMADRLGSRGTEKRPTSSFEFHRWERSDENPDLATDNGKIDLGKPNGLGTVGNVDYNPYIHIRPTTVNKQFKNAWERDDLVYIRTQYPVSEEGQPYHAEKAKLPVGRHQWNGGELILSRWDKPMEVVPWEEVADAWVDEFKERGVEFDIVPPKLLPILMERGVEILPPHKGMGKACNDAYRAKVLGEGPDGQNGGERAEGSQYQDNQGNPVDNNGKLIVEKVSSIDDIADDDFVKPHRSVEIPNVPQNVRSAIGAGDKPIIIKKNIFEKNLKNHPELTANENREILYNALFQTNLYGQTQPKNKPNYWVAIRTADKNSMVVLEVNNTKDNTEIVGWRYAGDVQLEQLKKQAEREDGQLLILTPEPSGAAAGLSTLPPTVSVDKGTEDSGTVQENGRKLFSLSEEQTHSENFKRWFGDWENDPENASKVVDKEGKPLVVYHQTNAKRWINRETGEDWEKLDWQKKQEWDDKTDEEWQNAWEEKDFYEFDDRYARQSIEMPAIFFSPNNDPYHEYGQRTIAAYLDIKNPAINPDIPNRGVTDTAGRDAMEALKAQGYDGFIRTDEDGNVLEYGVFSSEQIKSAESATYDDNGNMIPLSERFDSGKKDIRYSLSEDLENYTPRGSQLEQNQLNALFRLAQENKESVERRKNAMREANRQLTELNDMFEGISKESAPRQEMPSRRAVSIPHPLHSCY